MVSTPLPLLMAVPCQHSSRSVRHDTTQWNRRSCTHAVLHLCCVGHPGADRNRKIRHAWLAFSSCAVSFLSCPALQSSAGASERQYICCERTGSCGRRAGATGCSSFHPEPTAGERCACIWLCGGARCAMLPQIVV